jgi:SAM-dependent methyltransferase
MRSPREEIASRLCCPDDQESLRAVSGALSCSHCSRSFPFREGEILELLPSGPAEPGPNAEYAAAYHSLFHQTFESQQESIPWGLQVPPSWRLHRERQARAVLSLLQSGGAPLKDLILCDISAGIGDYTLSYAQHFKGVLHCDLSLDALRYAAAKCRRLGAQNVCFLRVDYFRLPFRRTIDRLLCLDTLVRGKDHEKPLLGQIQKALACQGRAIVDFHHWWHNPLRRLGLLPQNFGRNRSYARSGAEGLLRECGIDNWRLVRFHQEFEPSSRFAQGFSRLLPATRLIYDIGSALSRPALSESAKPSPSTDSQIDSPDSSKRAARSSDARV